MSRPAQLFMAVPSTAAFAPVAGCQPCCGSEPTLRLPRSRRETALLLAARRGHEAAVQELCQHGAVVDKANRSGVTPLAAAALFGHAGAVGALLARCAARLHRCRAHRLAAFLSLRLSARTLMRATPCRFLSCRGAGTGVCDLAHKRSPLHFAAMADAADVARLLLQHGANPTIVDATNATPCDLAVEYECTLVVQLLSSSR